MKNVTHSLLFYVFFLDENVQLSPNIEKPVDTFTTYSGMKYMKNVVEDLAQYVVL
jgi:hypothetical protein